MPASAVRFGVLGAARITPAALLRPAASHPEASVEVVAARNLARAVDYATRHGIPRVVDSYEAVVSDPAVDAVYIPLPNSLHAEWTLAALEAGKHVLCEKPFTANATEAEQVAARRRPGHRAGRTGGDGGVPLPLPPAWPTACARSSRAASSGRSVTSRPGCVPHPQQVGHPVPGRPGRRGHDGHGLLCGPLGPPARAVRSPPWSRPRPSSTLPEVDRAMDAELVFPSGHTALGALLHVVAFRPPPGGPGRPATEARCGCSTPSPRRRSAG